MAVGTKRCTGCKVAADAGEQCAAVRTAAAAAYCAVELADSVASAPQIIPAVF